MAMAWSRVNMKTKKPLKWWYHKFLCEFFYFTNNHGKYYKHLNALASQGFNLYGYKLTSNTKQSGPYIHTNACWVVAKNGQHLLYGPDGVELKYIVWTEVTDRVTRPTRCVCELIVNIADSEQDMMNKIDEELAKSI